MFDYQKVSLNLIKDLPDRTRDVIERRFGLKKESSFCGAAKIKREPLEAIGRDYGITRERVRQIENDGIKKIKVKAGEYDQIYQAFKQKIGQFGGFKKENLFLESLGGKESANHIFFLLNIGDSFFRFSGDQNFHPFWTKDLGYFDHAKKVVGTFQNIMESEKKPLIFQKCHNLTSEMDEQGVVSSLEISKNIYRNQDGLLGLKHWPEINPRGNKDKAYLVLKKEGKPLHFTSVAKLISDSALSQTVHNELIKDERFVLVGRGTYALKEWGYEPGEVKQVILNIFKKSGKPLSKEEIVERVAKQRFVKKNTILQNLSNKEYFVKTLDGKYFVKENKL